MGLDQASLKAKLLLDAGCGNGILTALLGNFGMEVVGLDISESVIRAQSNKQKFAHGNGYYVHFIQGNLFQPPLKKSSFDLVYSSGVLHHCPDTKETFLKIIPLLNKGGRMYIWLYGKRGIFVRIFAWHGRFVKKHVSLRTLFKYCEIISPLYKIAADILSASRIYPFRKRTTREITLDLFDGFSPQYNHSFQSHEVKEWFNENGFRNISVCGISKHGFGIRGDIF